MIEKKFISTVCVFMVFLIAACDDGWEPAPPQPAPDSVRVLVDIEPDWVEATWSLARWSSIAEGQGDSLLILPDAGEYRLFGGQEEGMVRYPMESPLVGNADLGDSISFLLEYSQSPWSHLYSGGDQGSWYDAVILADGGLLCCGKENGQARLAILDHNGEIILDLQEPWEGAYYQILPRDEGFILAGHQGDSILLSARTADGQPVWDHVVDFPAETSLAGLAKIPGDGFLILGNFYNHPQPSYPIIAHLDEGGQVLRKQSLAGPLDSFALGLALRSGRGCFVLQLRKYAEENVDFGAEVLVLDENFQLERIIPLIGDNCEPTGNILGTRDGGAILTYLHHILAESRVVTEVVRLTSQGLISWRKFLEIDGYQALNVHQELDSGQFILAGIGHQFGPHQYTVWQVEIDGDGKVIRERETNLGSRDIRIHAARQAWDGGLFTVGRFALIPDQGQAWVDRADSSWVIDPLPE